jgi:hypothetical protein
MLVAKLAAFGQQDQFGRRVALRADAVGERDQRLEGGRDPDERRHEIVLRLLDTQADRRFLLGFQQLPLADVLQVQTNEVDVFWRAGFERLAELLGRSLLLVDADRLVGERFGFVFL